MKQSPSIKSQAVIVITELSDGTLSVRSDNRGRGAAAKFADAAVRMTEAVVKEAITKTKVQP